MSGASDDGCYWGVNLESYNFKELTSLADLDKLISCSLEERFLMFVWIWYSKDCMIIVVKAKIAWHCDIVKLWQIE